MGGGLIKERKGVSSVVAGLLVAQLLVAFFAFTVLVPRFLGEGTRESSSGQERELLRQRELLTPAVEEANENGITVRVRNAGSVPSTVVGATYGFEGDLQTVPLQLTLAPGEERKVVLEPKSTEKVSLLTAYGNSFPVRAQLTVTGIIVSVVDQDTGEPVPGADVIVQLHSTYSEHRGITDPAGKFRAVNRGQEGHTYGVLVTAPGYENRVVTGRVEGGKVVEVRVETRFDPLSLSLPSSLVSQPTSLRVERQPFRASREVVTGYREEKTASGWRWKEWARVGTNTENRSLGPEAGTWVPTGRTYTIYGVGPLHTGLPSLPSGYRWTKVSGNWNSATYREEKNEVEILRAQGWSVVPQYMTFTEYQADVYHWEKVGSHKEYGSWTKSGTTTLATGLSRPPSGVVNGKEKMVSETEKRVWWVTSYTTQVPSGYVYRYTFYKRSWRWFPPGWGPWKYQGSGTETFTSYKGPSFTTGGGTTEDWKKEYTYSHTVYTTGTRYSYGYDTYTRTVRTVDDYGWVFKGRQTFSSPPVSGNGWDYRNVTSSTRQELTGYLATRTEPVYGWVERSGEHPPADGTTYWENGKLGKVTVLGMMGTVLEVKV
ncbi:MAG: carboxypeptidase-like regulatory domain-containing protein, partial [Candidatus Hadarchaeales archaeon]